jgi:hypothetical protein
VWRSSIARLIRLQHQNHAVNRGFPLHPSLKNAGRHEFCGLSTLNEGQTVEYEEVPNKGKTSAENLKVV